MTDKPKRIVKYYVWNNLSTKERKTVTHVDNGHQERDLNWYKNISGLWFCGNNYTRSGCAGHDKGDLRCMDLG